MRPQLPAFWAPLIVAAFIVLADNSALWHALWSTGDGESSSALIGAVLVALLALLVLPLQAMNFRFLFKPFAILLLLVSALFSYSISILGVPIDSSMVRSLLETDVREVSGHISGSLVWHFGMLGVLPSALLLWTRIDRSAPHRDLWRGSLIALASLAAAGTGIASEFKSIAFVAREHRELRMYLVPSFPLYALALGIRAQLEPADGRLRAVATDAVRAPSGPRRPLLFVLVVGETARAMQFSLNGYGRLTNPELTQRDVFSFSAVTSCGTSTAISVPCMFSSRGRAAFDVDTAASEENLLDVLKRLRIDVGWYDNNSGCKGVCARVPYRRPDLEPGATPCREGECYDEILLPALLAQLDDGARHDRFAVLHTHGSHGPDYGRRVPLQYKRFLPECRDGGVSSCPTSEIVNSYDNTIVYTDHVLARLIDRLARLSPRFDIAMLYVSDHGESLGEHGVFLHGFPYRIAPAEQTRVPLILWANDGFMEREGVTRPCLRGLRSHATSHDAIWHTVLGVYGVRSRSYDAANDLLADCRTSGLAGFGQVRREP